MASKLYIQAILKFSLSASAALTRVKLPVICIYRLVDVINHDYNLIFSNASDEDSEALLTAL